MYILQVIKNIFVVLDEHQKVKLLLLLLFFFFSALVQIVGVASIAPFIAIVSNPEVIQKNDILNFFYVHLNVNSNHQFIVGFAAASMALIFFSNGVSALTLWLLTKYSMMVGGEMQRRLYRNFLMREYIFHKTTNYTKTISSISQEVPRFVYMVMQPFLLLVSNLCVAILILIGLVIINPVIAFFSGLLIGGSYLLTYIFIKKSLVRHGLRLTERNEGLQSILSESFIGVKDIKLNSLEPKYISSFGEINQRGLNSSAYIALSGDLPKFVIESISFGAILLLAIFLLISSEATESVISLLSIYALAGYKLLPTMQQIYKSLSNISANGGVVDKIKIETNIKVPITKNVVATPLPEINLLQLNDITYHYPNADLAVIQNLSLTFSIGKLNTIAGPSGSGKSTLADVMLGLLPSSTGSMAVDGKPLMGQLLLDYQRSIGYVPQSIFILDDTVIANVAFGVPHEDVDILRVEMALRQANAMEFVECLPEAMYTRLGQDGKRLSGGQRQRIGIARTLYRQSKILILDEPTSALDIDSEYELMGLLGKLKNEVLIIVISHRPAAIKLSDSIVILDQGKIIAQGGYDELREDNDHFRKMMEKVFVE